MSDLSKPVTKDEIFLAVASGDLPKSTELPEPQTRIQEYLKKIAENGGSGGSSIDDEHISTNTTYSSAKIEQIMSGKMEFYPVYLEQNPLRFVHYAEDGTAEELNYAQLAEKYRDEKYFLYCEYASITFIPSLPPDDDPMHEADILEFSALWNYDGEQRVTTIKISSDELIKVTEFVVSEKTTIVTKRATDTAVTLESGKFYEFPEMASLTVTAPATGITGLRFTSGSTPTVFSVVGAKMQDFEIEANTVYEVSISDGYSLITGWSVV